jgi:hypothetical protein
MKMFAFICTRSKDLSPTTKKLASYLSSCNIETKLLVGSKSIFSGYARALAHAKPEDNDVIILCHDDIEILSAHKNFGEALSKGLSDPKAGFLGVAGTTKLSENATWWDHDNWREGKHRGFVLHGDSLKNSQNTYYGQCGKVLVLDGVFLAARAKVLKEIGLEKPDYLEGDWDFYDIHYTYSAYLKGYHNYTVPIFILHNSLGELVGRDSWHKNKKNFINQHSLPKEIK